ncbi:hypothetical protein ABL78_0222 [Leptomonas seymouri]|uniref:Uncharacterized protein n=1 Tax=Leptomonas seymouri TaxID=5684 RepID=A0A0N0P926_LEPSE|nr:hypothetical protein ABL78_0222 [Leptomonas seymouri]|eukprot:KPI90626.1 hypothetical protein ABL78_0222 [Leptomonas seymouri]
MSGKNTETRAPASAKDKTSSDGSTSEAKRSSTKSAKKAASATAAEKRAVSGCATRRQNATSQPLLSVSERQRVQRLQLLRLAHHSASAAVALLLSESQPLLDKSSLTSAVLSKAADTRSARSRAKGGPSVKQTGTAAKEQRGAPAAQLQKTQNTSVDGTAAPQQSDVYDKSCAAPPQESSPLVTAVPCSYAPLWRSLLQLQFFQEGSADANTVDEADAHSFKVGATTTSSTAEAAACSQSSFVTGAHTKKEAVAPSRPVSSRSAVADALQVLDAHWRDFFLSNNAPSGIQATHSPYLSRDEQYTLRRYATTVQGAEAVSVGAVPASSAVSRSLLGGERFESLSLIDYI